MSFYLTRNIRDSFDAVLLRLKDQLHARDYLIAADIDVQGSLKERVDADLHQIRIIGTNTPKVGLQLFSTDPKFGVLLPFSMVLQSISNNDVEVTMIDPEWLFRSADNPNIESLAREIKTVFKEILEKL